MSSQDVISIIVMLSVAVADMATDLYSVALPSIASYFNVQGSVSQHTISFNLIGIAISGLVYGPLSERYGRRPMMSIGMAIFAIASIICCIANNIILLILARFIQGIGSGVASVVGYAIIRDMYSGNAYSTAISKLNMVAALSPGIAPVVGSYVISYGFSWHFLFIIILLAAIATWILAYFKLRETLVVDTTKVSITDTICDIPKQYISIFKNYRFLGFAAIQGLTFMWIWAYITNYSFIFQSMGIMEKYFGYLISITVIFYMIGTLINRKCVLKIGMHKTLVIGLILPIISDSLLIYFYMINKLNIYIFESVLILSSIGSAFIISNNITFAFETIKNIGLGSAFISFCDMIFGAVGIHIVGKFFYYGVLPNLILTVTCSVVAIIIYGLLNKFSDT